MKNPEHSAASCIGRFWKKPARAFTLIELLAAIVVLSILSLLLFTILNQVSSTWTQVGSQIEMQQNGRSILNLIASELRVAALPQNRVNPNVTLPNSDPYDPSLQLIVDPPQLPANGTEYLCPHAIFWQAPIATDTTYGNLAEIGYFIRWDTTTPPAKPTNPRAVLCRFFVNPTAPGAGGSNYLIYPPNPLGDWTPNTWISSAVLDAVAPGTSGPTTTANTYPGWFADNVIGLWVRCLDGNGNPIVMIPANGSYPLTNYSFDSRLGYMAQDVQGNNYYHAKSGYADSSGIEHVLATLPKTIEIAIVVIDSRTASYVTAIPSYAPFPHAPFAPTGAGRAVHSTDSPMNFWNDINYFITNLPPRIAHGAHIYSIRVPLLNGG